MQFGCITIKRKSAFDSLVCESNARDGKCAIGIFSRCRCNILTLGTRSTSSQSISLSSIRKSFSPLKTVCADYETYNRLNTDSVDCLNQHLETC